MPTLSLLSLRRAACALACLLAALDIVAPTALAQQDAFPNLWVTDDIVDGLALRGDTLFLGGAFTYVGPPTGQLAVLDKVTGEADVSLPRVGSYLAQALAVVPDGAGGYYVGGDFLFASGEPRRNLARVLPDGTLDPNFRPDPIANTGITFGRVEVLTLAHAAPSPSGGGVLYVGGQFDLIDGLPRRGLAALDAETGEVLPFDAALGGFNPQSISGVTEVVARNGVLYVGGDFTTVAGQPRPNAVALDGGTGALLLWGASPDGRAWPAVLGDSTLYLDGNFSTVNGLPRPALVEVTLYDAATGGGAVTAWAPQQAVFGRDFVLTDSDLWVTQSSPPVLRRVSRETGSVSSVSLDPNLSGSTALTFDPVGGASGQGTLYLAARRAYGPGLTDRAPVVVGVDPATGALTGFEARGGGGPNEEDARTLAVEPGPSGRLFVGGRSSSFGGVRRAGLVALDLTTGRLIEGFDGQDFPAENLALSPDGRFLYAMNEQFGAAVKEFDLVTGTVRNFPTGAPAPPPSPRPPGPTRVLQGSALAVTEDRVYAIAPTPRAYDRQSGAEVWTTTGRLYFARNNGDVLLLDGPGGPGGADGTLYAAGPFFEVAGTPRDGFAAFAPRTGDVLAWDVQADPGRAEGYAAAWLDIDGDGPTAPALYLGGDGIETVQGQARASAFAVDPLTAAPLPWVPEIGLGLVTSLASQQRGDRAGGVIYGPFSNAYDAASGEPLTWDAVLEGSAQIILASEQHGAVFVGGAFYNSLRGSGHANVVAVTPAAPFLPTAGELSEPADVPATAMLALSGSNPFSRQTTLTLSLPSPQSVEVALYDVLGRRVAVLHDGPLGAGTHALLVDGSPLPAGVYVARAIGSSFSVSQALTLVK